MARRPLGTGSSLVLTDRTQQVVSFDRIGARFSSMPVLTPCCPLTAAKIAGLQATVLLLITLLIKARVQIKAASALGLLLLALQTLVFLAASGALGLAAIAAGAIAVKQRQAQAT